MTSNYDTGSSAVVAEPESDTAAGLTVVFQSNSCRALIHSKHPLAIAQASYYLQTLIESMGEGEGELVLPEENPFEAAQFLFNIISDLEANKAPSMTWNKCWAELSVKWMCQRYIVHFAELAFQHIRFIKAFRPELQYTCCEYLYCTTAKCTIPKLPSTHGATQHRAAINRISAQDIRQFWEAAESTLRHKQLQCAGSIATTDELLNVLVKQRQLLVQDHMEKVLSTHDACALAVMLEKLCK